MTHHSDVVFLFDVDNTLLDHDRVKQDLGNLLDTRICDGASETYWRAYESVRAETGHADFLASFQRCWTDSKRDPRWLPAADLLLDYPFSERLYPGALHVLEHVSTFATTAIVSDGDAVVQPRKIRRAGLWQAVDGRVLIFQDKQQRLADIAHRLPAQHYVMIDDKPEVLQHMKSAWSTRLTTVFPRQGHYAHDAEHNRAQAPPDISIDHIGDMLKLDIQDFYNPAQSNTGQNQS